jgi:hypothetical protein
VNFAKMLKVTLNKKAGSPHLGTIVTRVHNFASLGVFFYGGWFSIGYFFSVKHYLGGIRLLAIN